MRAAAAHGLAVGAYGGSPAAARQLEARRISTTAWASDEWILDAGLHAAAPAD